MPKVKTEKLERGVRGTAKTVKHMHRLVAQGKLDPTIQKIATWIRLQVPQDYRGAGKQTADAVFKWMKLHQVFQRDPFQIEKIEHPLEAFRPVVEARRTGAYKGRGLVVGDCDTLSAVVIASILGVLGFQYAFETVKVDKDRPDEFSHIYTAVRIGGEWYPLDPSTRGTAPGWRPPVEPDLLRRWNEKEIESTMSGMNGAANLGLTHLGADRSSGLGQDDWPEVPLKSEWVSREQYGYGIPRSTGTPGEPVEVPVPTGGRLMPMVPEQPAMSKEDMERPLSDYTRRLVKENMTRAERVSARAHSKPMYVKPGPYVKTAKSYPPGSRWNYSMVREMYPPRRPYVNLSSNHTPYERRVDEVLQQPIPVRRGKIRRSSRKTPLIFMRPNVPSAGLEGASMNYYARGMGQLTTEKQKEFDARVSTLQLTQGKTKAEATAIAAKEFGIEDPTTKAADKASTSVWSTITNTIAELVPTFGNAYAKKLEAKYAAKVAKATAATTGVNIPATRFQERAPQDYTPTPIWKSPWVWAGGALVLGGLVFMATRPSGGKKVRYRRRRRNPSKMGYRRRAA